MDVIASTGFGLRVSSQEEENNAFSRYGKKMMDIGFRNPLVIAMSKLNKSILYCIEFKVVFTLHGYY